MSTCGGKLGLMENRQSSDEISKWPAIASTRTQEWMTMEIENVDPTC